MKKSTLAWLTGGALAIGLLAAQAQVPGVNSTLNAVFTLAYDTSTMKPTYSATAFWSPTTSPTDVCSLSGSSTRTVKVRRVIFAGNYSAVMTDPINIVKRSTAYTAGLGYAFTKVPYDSTNTLSGSTSNASTVNMAEVWTGNPTAGTLVGYLADIMYTWNNITTGVGSPPMIVNFGGPNGSPIVLRGVAQNIAVNLGGLPYGANLSVSCTFEWTEDSDS